MKHTSHKRTDADDSTYEVASVVKFRETESTMWGPGLGEEDEHSGCNGHRVSVWEDKKVLRWMVVTAAQKCECPQCH